jgi:hypothetical protein
MRKLRLFAETPRLAPDPTPTLRLIGRGDVRFNSRVDHGEANAAGSATSKLLGDDSLTIRLHSIHAEHISTEPVS